MDYSANELLLYPGERKQAPFWTRIMQVALAMVIITVCVILLVAPTVFVTIFVLESFHSESIVPSHQQAPSVFLSKLITQPKGDDAIQIFKPLQHPGIIINVPDDQNSKSIRLSKDSKEIYGYIKTR